MTDEIRPALTPETKNFIEMKRAGRLLVDGAVTEGVWQGQADGFALVLKSDADLNTPWTAKKTVAPEPEKR